MTEKRFKEYDNGFEDTLKNEYFETNEEIIDKLNRLHEENTHLKQENNNLRTILRYETELSGEPITKICRCTPEPHRSDEE